MKKIIFIIILTILIYGCWMWDNAEHKNPYDPNTPNDAPGSLLLSYENIEEVTINSIKFRWQANSDIDFECYKLYRSLSSGFTPGDGNLVATISDQNSVVYEDTGLGPFINYYYILRVYDKGGLFKQSPEVRCITAPENVVIGGLIVVQTVGYSFFEQELIDVVVEPPWMFVSGICKIDPVQGYFVRRGPLAGVANYGYEYEVFTSYSTNTPVYAMGLAVSGNYLYMADPTITGKMYKSVDTIGTLTPIAINPANTVSIQVTNLTPKSLPEFFAVDGNDIWAVGANHLVQKFDTISSQWSYCFSAWSNAGNNGEIKFCKDIDVDANNVYIVGWGSHSIGIFDKTTYTKIKLIGQYGNKNKEFSNPYGIAVDSRGYIYVSDTGNNRIQIFDENYNFIGKFGKEGMGDYEFIKPRGLFIFNPGLEYLAVASDVGIRIFQIE